MTIQIAKDIGAYTFDKTAKTITITGITINSLSDFRVVANATDSTLIYNFADPTQSATWVSATGVLTLEYDTTSMDNADELIIIVDAGEPQIDFGLGLVKTSDETPIWARRTDVEAIISAAQTLTTSFANIGTEIDCAGYTTLMIWLKCTVQQSTGIQIKALAKHTYAGTESYSLPIEIVSSGLIAASIEVVQFPDAVNFLYAVKVKVDNVIPYLQFQVKMTTDGGTDGTIDTAYVTKGYGN